MDFSMHLTSLRDEEIEDELRRDGRILEDGFSKNMSTCQLNSLNFNHQESRRTKAFHIQIETGVSHYNGQLFFSLLEKNI